jgi:integrase
MDWAKAAGFRPGDNPVDGVSRALPKHKTSRQHHKALPYAQVPDFLHTLRESGSGTAVQIAFEFLILTATRTSEVLKATWSEIDLKGKVWVIPSTRMKMGREHRVPLPARCIEILEDAQALSDGGEFVFPGRSPAHHLSNMCFHAILRRMNRSDCTPHGFRSSFRDWTEERTNYPRTVTEAALAHVVADKTEAAYRRTDLFERRRKLMNAWAAFVTGPTGKVIHMPGTG